MTERLKPAVFRGSPYRRVVRTEPGCELFPNRRGKSARRRSVRPCGSGACAHANPVLNLIGGIRDERVARTDARQHFAIAIRQGPDPDRSETGASLLDPINGPVATVADEGTQRRKDRRRRLAQVDPAPDAVSRGQARPCRCGRRELKDDERALLLDPKG